MLVEACLLRALSRRGYTALQRSTLRYISIISTRLKTSIYAGMIQTESPYYQPVPEPPAPFSSSAESMPGDPDYSVCTGDNTLPGCDASWAVRIVESSGIEIGGAGLYTWFNNYVQEPCVDGMDCQLAQVYIENTYGNVSIYNLITIGAVDMLVDDSEEGAMVVPALDNLFLASHPFWSEMAVYRPVSVPSDGSGSSGGGSGDTGDDVYVPPAIWSESNPAVGCIPPCTLILPPFPLGSTTTITWPPLTTSLRSLSGTVTMTITTTISIPVVTTTEIEWWPIVIGSTDIANASFSPVQSVMPDPIVLTFPGGIAPFPPSQIPDPEAGTTAASTSTSTDALLVVIPTTSHPVTIQPQPTISMATPPPSNIPSVTWSSSKPSSTCTIGCGRHHCGLFGCGTSCGLFGCGGGCGIWGCGGGCGLFGCGGGGCSTGDCDGGCSLLTCGGLGCTTGDCGSMGCPSGDCSGCPTGGCGGFEPDPDENNDCTSLMTATVCTEIVSIFVPTDATTTTTTTKVRTSLYHDRSSSTNNLLPVDQVRYHRRLHGRGYYPDHDLFNERILCHRDRVPVPHPGLDGGRRHYNLGGEQYREHAQRLGRNALGRHDEQRSRCNDDGRRSRNQRRNPDGVADGPAFYRAVHLSGRRH